jgi:hypothetical protein
MRIISDRVLAILVSLFAAACFAQAVEEGAASAPEPTVSVVWVIAFLGIFVGVCIWIGIAIWRNERKNRASNSENARL